MPTKSIADSIFEDFASGLGGFGSLEGGRDEKKKNRTRGKKKILRMEAGKNDIVARLSRKTPKSFCVEDLDVATLRPLVDLAYWSTFLEVRRDAAAAFATLAMNVANLPVLSEAGALGATLALIGVNNGMSDSHIHRDAVTALACLLTLPDVKKRLLKAPDGLRSIFYTCRSPNTEVKRAAVKALANFATVGEAKEALVASGGSKFLFGLANGADEKTKRQAVSVLKVLAQHPPNHARICADTKTLQSAISLLINTEDPIIRRGMIDFVRSIASNDLRKQLLVEHGVLSPLLDFMDPAMSSLEAICIVFNCMYTFSGCENVLQNMLDQGVVESLSRILFEELAEIREYREMRKAQQRQRRLKRAKESGATRLIDRKGNRAGRRIASAEETDAEAKLEDELEETEEYFAEKGVNGNSTNNESVPRKVMRAKDAKEKSMAELEDDTLRYGLMILYNLSAHEPLRNILVTKGVPSSLFEESILASSDKRISRIAARILVHLSDTDSSKRSERPKLLLDAGVLYPIRTFLRGADFKLRAYAARIAAQLAANERARIEIAKQSEILRGIVHLCNPHDDELNHWVARLLAELSESSEHYFAIVNSSGLDAVFYMISPRSKCPKVRKEAVRCLSNVSSDTKIRDKIVHAGVLGHLISMSKSGTGLIRLYATATLTNLEHDTAAVRIQMVFRGYFARQKRTRDEREKARQENDCDVSESKTSLDEQKEHY